MSIWPAALFAIILLLFGGGAKGAQVHTAHVGAEAAAPPAPAMSKDLQAARMVRRQPR